MENQKNFNFVYKTTNLINGKQYIGDHSCDHLEKDYYLGSGTYILSSIKKYKKINFKREIIEHFNTKEEAFLAQSKYINEHNTLVPNGYNINPNGGYNPRNSHSYETRQKLSKPKTQEHKDKLSKANTGKIGNNLGKKFDETWCLNIRLSHQGLQSGPDHPMYNKHHSDESKLKMRNKKLGITLSNEHKENLSKSHMGRTSPNKDKNLSDIHKENIRKASLGKIRGPYKKRKLK